MLLIARASWIWRHVRIHKADQSRAHGRSSVSPKLLPGRHAILLAGILGLFALAPSASAQYRYDHWTADTGLPQNSVRGICQTPDGYLWIATLDGVARFDGVRFSIFNKSNTAGIQSNRFASMIQGRNGDLWFFIEGGRITRYHRGEFQTYGKAQGLPDTAIQSITGDGSGRVWVLFTDTIAKWDENAGRFVDITPKDLRLPYQQLRWEQTGFWGWDQRGLHLFVDGRFLSYPLPAWFPGSSIWRAGLDGSGTVWLDAVDGRFVSIARGETSRYPGGALASFAIPYVDHRGHSWTIRFGHRLERSIEYPTSGVSASIPFSMFYEDSEDNLWLGTEGQGLYRLQSQSIRAYSKEQGLVDRNVYPIYQDRAGAVWIGAWRSGLSRFQGGRFTNYTVADGLPNGLATALSEDSAGHLWIATHGGLCVFAGGRLRKPPALVLPDHAMVQAIHEDRKHTLWFGTPQGLVSYKNGATRVFTTRDGLATDDVRVIVEAASGDLWIGGYGGLTRLRDGRFSRWRERDGLSSDSVRAIYVDSDDTVWIGTYDNGLDRLKDGKITRYDKNHGLFSNGVFQILEDARGNLWMSCNQGIYRVSKRELSDFAAGTRASVTSVAFGKVDGMVNVECNGGISPAGIKTRDGKLWFPTQDGVAVIDPEIVTSNPKAPSVVIESSLVDRVPYPVVGPLRIAPGHENLEIQYTALSFIKSEQIQFKYKLDGLDSAWVDAGSRRTAYYPHLPPGKYVFRVIAANSDGIWNLGGRSLPVVVMAPFYRTWWFSTIMALAAAALVSGAWFYRIAQLQRVQTAQREFSQQLIANQETERKRIAAELHDSLGQRLVVINNLALFSLRGRKQAAELDEQARTMEEISTEAALAIEETRSISYNLRPFQLDRLGLRKAIQALIRSVSKASEIRFSSEIADIDGLFPEELRISFYRIVQEALSNIMKHSEATEASVGIERSDGHVVLTIRDNGRGFAPETRGSQTGHGGFGLTGIAERARLLGGGLKVHSEPGGATVITVEIDLEADRHV
jgi:signal transduction histidine kinase/ligand-binding sensor domain-containing protein